MHYVDKIDKEVGLVRLTVGQVCSAGIAHNIYTGERKCYAMPFVHKVWVRCENCETAVPYYYQQKEIGLAIRISNAGTIISNPSYTGNAIISFLDKKFEHCDIHSVKIVRVNRRSVNVEPIEYKEVVANV